MDVLRIVEIKTSAIFVPEANFICEDVAVEARDQRHLYAGRHHRSEV